jgi:hypothetical protein
MHKEVVRLLLEREDVDKTDVDEIYYTSFNPFSAFLGAE